MKRSAYRAAAAVVLMMATAGSAIAADCKKVSPEGRWLYEGRFGPCILEANKAGKYKDAVCAGYGDPWGKTDKTFGTITITAECDVKVRMTVADRAETLAEGKPMEGFVVVKPSMLAGLMMWDDGASDPFPQGFTLMRKQ